MFHGWGKMASDEEKASFLLSDNSAGIDRGRTACVKNQFHVRPRQPLRLILSTAKRILDYVCMFYFVILKRTIVLNDK